MSPSSDHADRSHVRAVWLLLGSVAGLVLTVAILPTVARTLPNATSRIGAIGEVLDAESSADIVVVGNSVVMGGIDVSDLTSDSSRHRTGWNLSSPGQDLLESFFIVDQLPEGVETLVLPVEVRHIVDEPYSISSSKIYAYQLYGYEHSDLVSDAVNAVADADTNRVFAESWLKKRLGSRFAIRTGIDTVAVELITGTDVSEGDDNVDFPRPYENRLSDAGLAARLERNHVERLTTPTSLPDPFVNLLDTYAEWARQHEVDVLLVVLPEHPNQQRLSPENFHADLTGLLETATSDRGFELLAAAELFDDPAFFVDHVHIHTSGAAVLTELVQAEVG